MKKIIKYALIVLIIGILIILSINVYVIVSAKQQIITNNDYSNLKDVDCIIILGAGIWGDKPSPMLEDRLLQGIDLYKNNVSSKIIMSGDHSKENYDEVNAMKYYAIEKGVPSENIFMDHAGFSTYESIYRAKEILARNKDFVKCIFKPEPTYLGDTIPVSGSGDVTNDK